MFKVLNNMNKTMKRVIFLSFTFFMFNASIQTSLASANWKSDLLILELQATGPSADVKYEGMFWVKIDNSDWGTANCPADWHIIDATKHPHQVALFINAYSLGRKVRIDVDETYKTGDYCRIMKVRM